MNHSKFYFNILLIIAAISALTWITTLCVEGKYYANLPDYQTWLGDIRFYLFCSFLILLSWDAIHAYFLHKAMSFPEIKRDSYIDLPFKIHPLFLPGIISLIITIILSIRACAMTKYACDEGIWNYVGYAWSHFNLPPYTGTIENKTPGIFYIFYISNWLFGVNNWFPRLLGIVVMGLTGLGLYALAARIRDQYAGILVLILYGLSSVSDRMDGQSPTATETYVLAFTVLAANLIFLAAREKSKKYYLGYLLLIGASLGCSISFKQVAVFSVLGLMGLHFSLPNQFRKNRSTYLRDTGIISIGILTLMIISIVPLLVSHVGIKDYFYGAWQLLLTPGTAESSLVNRFTSAILIHNSVDLRLYLPVLLIAIWLYKPMKELGIPLPGIILWLFFEIIGAHASGRYFSHQLRMFLPPLTLLATFSLHTLILRYYKWRLPEQGHLALITGIIFMLWWPLWITQYNPKFPHVADATVAWLHNHTTDHDYIYIFSLGEGNAIQAYSKRRSASRFFSNYFIEQKYAQLLMRQDFQAHPPKYIVTQCDNYYLSSTITNVLPGWIDHILATQYHIEKSYEFQEYSILFGKVPIGYIIYRNNKQ